MIAEIDPKDFEVAVQQDEASLESAEANYEAARVNIPLIGVNTNSTLTSAASGVQTSASTVQQAQRQLEAAKAQVQQADANNIKAQLDLTRYRPLVEKDVISKQQFDATVATCRRVQGGAGWRQGKRDCRRGRGAYRSRQSSAGAG